MSKLSVLFLWYPVCSHLQQLASSSSVLDGCCSCGGLSATHLTSSSFVQQLVPAFSQRHSTLYLNWRLLFSSNPTDCVPSLISRLFLPLPESHTVCQWVQCTIHGHQLSVFLSIAFNIQYLQGISQQQQSMCWSS